MAQLGVPDMRIPIQLALTYPNRLPSPAKPLDLLSCGPLNFLPPDQENFPCLKYAKEAVTTGGTACAILNGANEAAVGMFLKDEIGFNDIPRKVRHALEYRSRSAESHVGGHSGGGSAGPGGSSLIFI